MTKKIPLTLNLVDASQASIEAPDDMTLLDMLPHLLQRLGHTEPGALDQYVVFVCRAVNLHQTLAEVDVRSGDALHIVKADSAAVGVRLQLFLPRQSGPWREIRRYPAYLGRYDDRFPNEPLDVDVTDILPPDKRRAVSRQQAEFLYDEADGRWYVQLREKAQSPMFVNSHRVLLDQRVLLEQNDVLSIGPSPNQPDLQFIIHLEAG